MTSLLRSLAIKLVAHLPCSICERLAQQIRYMSRVEALRGQLYSKLLKRIGSDVHISEAVIINFPSRVELGDHVSINPFCYIHGEGGVTIGNNVRIGFHICLISIDMVYRNAKRPIRTQGIAKAPIVIEDDVWLGANSTILKGVRIGKGSVVGAGAVVTRDVSPYVVVVGVPARIIKERR